MSFRLLRPASQIGNQFVRSFKSDLKIKWVRPEKISSIDPRKSGDASHLPQIDSKDFVLDVKNVEELKVADDAVKDLFRLENNRRIQTSDVYRDMFVKEVQRHPLDYGSMEAKIAHMTATIRRLQEQVKDQHNNTRMKCILKEMIEKRKKFLKYLRRWDYKRFEWLLEKLDLIYKPPPSEYKMVTRKDSLRKLTDIHCETIKQERLEEYRKHLESQQIDFLERKLSNLKFIKKEQEECQVKVTVTADEIGNVEKQLKNIREIRSLLQNDSQADKTIS